MIDNENFKDFQTAYPEATVFTEGGFDFIHIPLLKMPGDSNPSEVEALLCPQMRDGYATRLFLSAEIPGKGNNWTQHHMLGRSWFSWSWQNVHSAQQYIQILLGHLDALR
jgi:hypothetical protein